MCFQSGIWWRHTSQQSAGRQAIPTGSHCPGDTQPSEAHVRVAASAPLLAALEVKRPVIGRKPSFLKVKPYIMTGMRRQEGGGVKGRVRGGEGEGGRPRFRKPFHFDTAVSRKASPFMSARLSFSQLRLRKFNRKLAAGHICRIIYDVIKWPRDGSRPKM